MKNLGKDIFKDGHLYKMPNKDKRSHPDCAASAPFDVDGYHWRTGYPRKPGYYQLALTREFETSFVRLPVVKAYYEGNHVWSRRKCPHNSLLRVKERWEDEDGYCYVYAYYPEYWCELPESGELLPCRFDW